MMALNTDLTGLGMAAALAGRVGHAVTLGLAGTGTAQVGATAIGTTVTVGVPTAGNTAYTLPTGAQPMLKEWYFFNNAATAVTALIYPPTGGATLNGSTSAAVSVAQNKGAQFMLVAGSGGAAPQWVTLAGA
jgi:hypothetical protein